MTEIDPTLLAIVTTVATLFGALVTFGATRVQIRAERRREQSKQIRNSADQVANLRRWLKAAESPVSGRKQLAIEETAASFYGRPITFQEIELLLKADSPSVAIREYLGAKAYGYVRVENGQVYLQGHWREKRQLSDWLRSPAVFAGVPYFLFAVTGLGFLAAASYILRGFGEQVSIQTVAGFVFAASIGLSFLVASLLILLANAGLPSRKMLHRALRGVPKTDDPARPESRLGNEWFERVASRFYPDPPSRNALGGLNQAELDLWWTEQDRGSDQRVLFKVLTDNENKEAIVVSTSDTMFVVYRRPGKLWRTVDGVVRKGGAATS